MSVLAFDLFQGFILLLVACACLITPSVTRRDVFFGVTVAPDTRTTPAGRRIARRYRLSVAGGALAALVGFALLATLAQGNQDQRISFESIGFIVVMLAFILFAEGCYLLAYRACRALRAPASVQTSGATAELRPRRYSDYVPWAWEALPLAIIAATALTLAMAYNRAPAIIATHYDAAGQPNAFAAKTIGSFFSSVWIQLALYVALTGLSVLTANSSKSQGGEAQQRFRRIWIRYLFGVKSVMLAMLGVIGLVIAEASSSQTSSMPPWLIILPLVVTGAIALLALALALRTGQGGARLAGAHAGATDRTDDRYWLAGAIYINRNDPALFVEKRFGVGWTINFGNLRAIAVMIGIVVVVGAPGILITLIRR